MNKKMVLGLFVAAAALVLLSVHPGWAQNQLGVSAPVIKNAFAIKKIMYGDTLKVYIEAEEPSGDMDLITAVVDQQGYGRYQPSWTYLKPADRKYFKGYLQWNTFSSKTQYLSEWTQIVLTITVFDKAGNGSNALTFPISFETGVKKASSYPLPPPFDQGNVAKLGVIDIDLFDPTTFRGAD
jgi:hypothetical protein